MRKSRDEEGSAAELRRKVTLLARELAEARAQQGATAGVLKVISRSAFDLEAVLTTLITSAIELCDATRGVIWLSRGEQLFLAAHVNYAPEWVSFAEANPITPAADAQTTSGLAAFTGETVNVEDIFADPRFRSLAGHSLGDYRAGLAVPLKRDGKVVGVISLSRPDVRLFTERQMALVQTFADQAIIAIENVRLFEEVQARNRELSEALEQQTATSAILRVISSSPTNVQPVFDAIAESAARLCEAFDAVIRLKEGDTLALGAHYGSIPVDPKPWAISKKWTGGRAVLERATIHVRDLADATEEFPEGSAMAHRVGHRTMLAVPLLREGEAIGVIGVRRAEVKPFSEKQISLLKTFADQAVIAIENVRLFDEVQARNRDLSETLGQQVATGAILRAIAASPTDIQPVLDAVAESAAQLCDAQDASIMLRRGDVLAVVSHQGAIQIDYTELPLVRDMVGGRTVLDRTPIHVHDMAADREFPASRVIALRLGVRTLLATPLMQEGEAIGVVMIRRTDVRPFSERQIELLQTFADQAVIAIANVRLFEEVQSRNRELSEALEQQVATSAILQVIASSPTDIQPVLKAVTESAAQLCDAYDATTFFRRGDILKVGAHHGPISIDFGDLPVARDVVTGRSVLDREPVHVHDLWETEDQFDTAKALARRLGFRTILATPLLREGEAIGALMIRRSEVRPFSEKQIALLKTFADQAVIAIENVRLFEEVQARNRALNESLEQQTAMSGILRVISRSPTDIQPVFETIAESAARLCQARYCAVFRFDGELIHFMAQYGMSPEADDLQRRAFPSPPGRTSAAARAMLSGRVEEIPDVEADPDFALGSLTRTMGVRGVVSVPMLRDGLPVGAINITRTEPGHFPDSQIELLKTFADQAVIAIENVRLFDEVQARNRDLTESLERQTAMSDILRVISRSPTDVQPVFETIAESAARLCGGHFCTVFRFDGELIHFVAQHGLPPEGVAEQRRALPRLPGRGSAASRAILSSAVEQIPDVNADPDYHVGKTARAIGARSIVAVPMLRDGRPIGSINIGRAEPGYFPPRQVQLLQTFADQAVIAIENVRLFEEVQARNRDLTESLERQTAMSDILRVISRSPTDVQPVFETIAESAARLCGGHFCTVFRFDGDLIHFVAQHGLPPEGVEEQRRAFPKLPGRGSGASRAIRSAAVEQIPDVNADPDYQVGETARAIGARSVLAVPMLRDGRPLGSINIGRAEPGYFPPRQVELLQTFADQAVIAIENVRLFEEVQARTAEVTEALQQQTATADVLKVISRSAFDLQPVLQALVDSAIRLCGADLGGITLRDGDDLKYMAGAGQSPELRDYEINHPHPLGRGSFQGRAAIEGKTIHVPDALADPEYERKEAAVIGDFRAVLCVPLKRGADVIGVFGLVRRTAGPFAPRQIELVESFADQAVIAIENARLFEEVQARTRELTESLERQTAASEILRVIARSPTDVQPVFDTIATSVAQLCAARYCIVFGFDGKLVHFVAEHGLPPEAIAGNRKVYPMPPGRGSAAARAILSRAVEQIPDVEADPDFAHAWITQRAKVRSLIAVPMLKDGVPAGAIVVAREDVGLFPERQIDLLQTFADQAVIAIENVRLFEEVQARTAELTKALQQQTATADVLKVISRSAFDLKSVLQTLVESAVRLCEADKGMITRLKDGKFSQAEAFGFSPEFIDYYFRTIPVEPGQGTVTGRALLEGKVIHIDDVQADPGYTWSEGRELGGFRTIVGVPMLREGIPVGVMALTRSDVRPFTERQVDLVQTFADQAVIAIENVRLFEEVQARTNELEGRTRELTESLQQQTATADVLKVISRSTFDLQAVLDTLLESASRLCRADKADIVRFIDGQFQYVSMYGYTPEYEDYARSHPLEIGRGSANGRAMAEKRTIHIADVQNDPEYRMQSLAAEGNFRTVLSVPLLREGSLIGIIALLRSEPQPFSEKEIDLVTTFADQAVIAIENVRLFTEVGERNRELGEALQQQTATADVLKVISRSAFDLQTVLDTLLESAARLCRADKGGIVRVQNGVFRYVASHGYPPAFRNYIDEHPPLAGRGSVVGRVVSERGIVQIEDVRNDPDYVMTSASEVGDFHTALGVPLMREGDFIGVFVLTRTEIRPFSNAEIELVTTFADQAVIAIENVRLFDEVQARTAELSESLQQQTATADVLKVISRSAFDIQAVLDTLAESAARLCEADVVDFYRLVEEEFKWAATFGEAAADRDHTAIPRQSGRGSVSGRVLLEHRTVHVPDFEADAEFTFVNVARKRGVRAILGVPLLRGDALIGLLLVMRKAPGPFSAKQIELAETFADQAVIAIENARLFQAVQHRTEELSHSLQELRTAQDRLIQTEKLASLGQLTAGIAHEIKNPLNFVNNFSALSADLIDELRESLAGVPVAEKLRDEIAELTAMLKGNLEKVVQHGKRADSIVKNMLLHSRAGSGDHRPSDINAIVEESLNLAYHGARAEKQGFNITMEKSLDPSAGEVDLFPQEITRVLLNLISNGFYAATKRKAQADGGGFEPILAATTKSLGDSVEIRIRDNGTGIPPEVKEKMFNPFFTTKPAGEGTGLGLSLSHDIIVKQHAGTIEVETEPGAFTEFRIVLPRGAASLGKSGGNA